MIGIFVGAAQGVTEFLHNRREGSNKNKDDDKNYKSSKQKQNAAQEPAGAKPPITIAGQHHGDEISIKLGESVVRFEESVSVFRFGESLDGLTIDGLGEMDDEHGGGGGPMLSDESGRASSTADYDRTEQSGESEDAGVSKIAKQEAQHVRACRVVVLLLILTACAIVSSATYIFLRREEIDDSDADYEKYVASIQDAITSEMKHLKNAFTEVAETFTATGLMLAQQRINNNEQQQLLQPTNATTTTTSTSFPFVTVPHFEVLGKHARAQSGVELFSFAPLVEMEQVEAWQTYATANQGWIQQGRNVLRQQDDSSFNETLYITNVPMIQPMIYDTGANGQPRPARGNGPYTPVWQTSPPVFDPQRYINYNLLAESFVDRMLNPVALAGDGLLSEVLPLKAITETGVDDETHSAIHDEFISSVTYNAPVDSHYYNHPHSVYLHPVHAALGSGYSRLTGLLLAVLPWDRYLANKLPSGVNGIYAVIKNNCGDAYTYVLEGQQAKYLGRGELYESGYKDTKISFQISQFKKEAAAEMGGHCTYILDTYSSDEFRDSTISKTAMVFCVAIAALFGGMAGAFLFYDGYVRRRNAKVVSAAAKSDAILASLFPSTIRDRLFSDAAEENRPLQGGGGNDGNHTNGHSKGFLGMGTEEGADHHEGHSDGEDHDHDKSASSLVAFRSKPIADLFPETTIMFGDIAGFTAWSSIREPSDVFTLLETLYHAFDQIAKKRRVFKVETVGDCYVAVAGLPEPRSDHAVVMAKFARECISKMRHLTRRLEVTLGPDTGDLSLRVGLHSGPVTGGVLRGENSRFQLFGDTMNTASRIESNGVPDQIQISQETADLLAAAGKQDWFKKREDKIVAKGKGVLQCYWLKSGGGKNGDKENNTQQSELSSILQTVSTQSSTSLDAMSQDFFDGRTARLIDWNVDVLQRILKQIVARRNACPATGAASRQPPNEKRFASGETSILDEVAGVIALPKVSAKTIREEADPESIELPTEAVDQLHDFVCSVAAMYRENSFHSFEHASHVALSASKLLSRIVPPGECDDGTGQEVFDHTYGITSDPLTQFACIFSALIHDVDHAGVSNEVLMAENPHIASYFKGRCVAEQNSVELAWNLLQDDCYKELRDVIYTTDAELRRFRALLVNSVIATDLFDEKLKLNRDKRWKDAFSESAPSPNKKDDRNRKATIVIECLMQAADVAHVMQHWHIYRKWNERYFFECYEAYRAGRIAKDPAEDFYEAEIDFFDSCVLPLAQKLNECGVFGTSGEEWMHYALKNRAEWEELGKDIVDEMLETVNKGDKGKNYSHMQPEKITISSPQLNQLKTSVKTPGVAREA